jgi:hypothetical protein
VNFQDQQQVNQLGQHHEWNRTNDSRWRMYAKVYIIPQKTRNSPMSHATDMVEISTRPGGNNHNKIFHDIFSFGDSKQ